MVRLALVLAFAATAALADEKAPADKLAAPATEDALAVAQLEFQTIKATRGTAPQQPGIELPKMITPELQLGGDPPVVERTVPPQPDEKMKAANWLVDGVLKKSKTESREESADEHTSSFGREGLGADQRQVGWQVGHGKGESVSRSGKPSAAEGNPLDRYMAAWMTPRDFVLLQPVTGGEIAGNLAGQGGLRSATPSDFSLPGASGTAPSTLKRINTVTSSAQTDAPRKNPFLTALVSLPQPPTTLIPTSGANSIGNSVSRPSIPMEPAAAQSNVPDFVKPNDDAKYFKQLKRF